LSRDSAAGAVVEPARETVGIGVEAGGRVPRVGMLRRSLVLERVRDVVVIVLFLPLIIPVGLLIAAAILADSPGPILYRAPRVGKDGRWFKMLKFRKMRRDAAGPGLTLAYDERFTPIGRFLAVSRLDELPQLWNVLRGEMTLVGPRPETIDFVSRYRAEYAEILKVRPGLTGVAQLEHFNEGALLDTEDPIRHYVEEILPRKLELDLTYVRTGNPVSDIRLIMSTFTLPLRVLWERATAVLQRRGARISAEAMVVFSAAAMLVAFTTGIGPAR
jgi:lipopolysaccharide/colanic/teichoic acid biosynthesis glycosyltransferase